MPGDEVIGDSFQPFLFEVWHWLPDMPKHCENTLRGIAKCRANSTTIAIIAVRQVKPFEVGRERNTVVPPKSGQSRAQKFCPLLGGVRYWGGQHFY
ncbi:hypothetical protein AVEN_214061-1 [Araneus ventricosus]|uniref:Uncharacterized protein n=1 Tax=Araneus ventricosus TaxID=182803 RepID=A0A4Y2QZC2_ARAVE|nr:hypothetical protein AVEN_214061-1 [Araneus ventricosus]